jgi:hypothetical protein
MLHKGRRAAAGNQDGWSPADLGANLLAWYDASDSGSLTLSGADVTQWDDLSGNGYHLTQSGSESLPDYSATAINSKPGVIFNADRLENSSFDGFTNAISVFVVGTMDSGTPTFGRMVTYRADGDSADTGANSCIFLLRNSGSNEIHSYRNFAFKSNKAISLSTAYSMGSIYDNSDNTVYVDNAAGTPVSSSGSFGTPGKLLVGGSFDAGELWVGIVQEIIIADKALNSTERSDLQSYVAAKWSL